VAAHEAGDAALLEMMPGHPESIAEGIENLKGWAAVWKDVAKRHKDESMRLHKENIRLHCEVVKRVTPDQMQEVLLKLAQCQRECQRLRAANNPLTDKTKP
jgi:hypothetical protein